MPERLIMRMDQLKVDVSPLSHPGVLICQVHGNDVLQGLFAAIDEDDFRADISSTELRQQQADTNLNMPDR